MKRLVIFGAGPIGRMLAHVFKDEYQTVFVDINQPVIDQINYQKEFGIQILGADAIQETRVEKVSAVHSGDTSQVRRCVVEAELVLTACGMNALPFVAPVIADALEHRLAKRRNLPLFVVACENATEQNSTYLRTLIFQHLTEEAGTQALPILFTPDCMIDRVSLIPKKEELGKDALMVKVEEYFQLCIKKQTVAFPFTPSGVTVVDDLEPIKKQKLFTVNALHALIAYYGYHFGYPYIHEALQDARIKALVGGVLYEIKTALQSYGISESAQDDFASRVLARFGNANLLDSVERVGRDPIRKAKSSERLLAPALLNLERGFTPSYLASGLAALYLYNNPADPEAQELLYERKTNGFGPTLAKYSSITKTDTLYALVEPPFYLGTRH